MSLAFLDEYAVAVRETEVGMRNPGGHVVVKRQFATKCRVAAAEPKKQPRRRVRAQRVHVRCSLDRHRFVLVTQGAMNAERAVADMTL